MPSQKIQQLKRIPQYTFFENLFANRLFGSAVWVFAGKLFSAIATVVINGLLARMLTPEELGVYFILLSIVGMAALVAQLGLGQVIVRQISSARGLQDCASIKPDIQFILLVVVIISCVVFFIGQTAWMGKIIHAVFQSQTINSNIFIPFLTVPFLALQTILAEGHRGFDDIPKATVFGGVSTNALLMSFLLGAFFCIAGMTLSQALVFTLIATVVSVVISFALFVKKVHAVSEKCNTVANYKAILSASYPLLVYSLMIFAVNQAPLWIIGSFLSEESVAYYGAALRLVQPITMPLLIVNAIVASKISEMHIRGKHAELERMLRSCATLAGVPSLILLFVFMFFSADVLAVVFGEKYRHANDLLIILCAGKILSVLAGSCGMLLIHTGNEKVLTVTSVIVGLLTVALSILLVQYGAVGIAIAVATGISIQNIILLIVGKAKVGIWTSMHINFFGIKKLL
ncbi:oligosaccharide flippase family protein [Desulfogranum japonicum]|uniref:oligosaccharide flippase family protein n=1 Tax=Desulfogranum japonicum TaxID=231447 RepID=UPI0004052F0E|nr:oligosaccharide flippase family protein [Desulfogranum japonicum]